MLKHCLDSDVFCIVYKGRWASLCNKNNIPPKIWICIVTHDTLIIYLWFFMSPDLLLCCTWILQFLYVRGGASKIFLRCRKNYLLTLVPSWLPNMPQGQSAEQDKAQVSAPEFGELCKIMGWTSQKFYFRQLTI